MKKILLLKSGISKGGGLEKYTLKLAQAFWDRGCDLTLVTSGNIPSFPFPSLSCPMHTKISLRKLQTFDRFCSKLSADLVFGMDRNRFQTHLRAGNGVHAAYLQYRKSYENLLKRLTLPLNPLHRLILSMEKEAFEHKKLQKLFTNSHMVKKEILDHYKVAPEKIEVVHNGVEWKEMETDFQEWPEKKEILRSKLNLPDGFQLLFVGHHYCRKGLDPLLQALALLAKEPFHLSVIGKEKNIPSYRQQAEKLGIAEKVSFLGDRSDIRSFYQLADAVIIPSFYDPFANVTVEALAMGVFVLSSKTNGGHEILTPENGLVLPSLEPGAIAASLQKAFKIPKTKERSAAIRNSISHLDFSHQLKLITDSVLL